jgi:hypothetical protein
MAGLLIDELRALLFERRWSWTLAVAEMCLGVNYCLDMYALH